MFVHRNEGELGHDGGGQNGKEGKGHHKKKVESDKKDKIIGRITLNELLTGIQRPRKEIKK